MRMLLTRTFTVDAAPAAAWQHLIDAEHWPSWAHHLRTVEVTPPGPVGPGTHAVLRLKNRTRATVTVTELVDGECFRWDGTFLWLRLGYDHRVGPADTHGSEITFTVLGDGVGIGSLGRFFAQLYARNLDRAIPRLQAELASRRQDTVGRSDREPVER